MIRMIAVTKARKINVEVVMIIVIKNPILIMLVKWMILARLNMIFKKPS